MGAHGYQRFSLSKPGVAQNVADRTSTEVFALPNSFNFIFSQTSPIICEMTPHPIPEKNEKKKKWLKIVEFAAKIQ